MGRPRTGWRLEWRGGRPASVRFTHAGKQHEYGTGQRDPSRAGEEAARIYADVVSGRVVPEPRAAKVSPGSVPLQTAAVAWLRAVESHLDELTFSTYARYFKAFLVPHFVALGSVHPQTISAYIRKRLRVVRATSIRKELSPLRGLMSWAHEEKMIAEKIPFPGIPKRVLGTKFKTRRRGKSIEISPREVAAVLAALPERSRLKYPVRARFIVAYETSLRPSAIDGLSVPEHYTKGARYLLVTPDLDKSRNGRPLPLTDKARAALDSVLPKAGLIFGAHRYTRLLRNAAKVALPKAKADVFAAYDLRASRITHILEDPKGSLVGAQYMAGHKLASTTDKYVKPTLRAAEAALGIKPPTPARKARKKKR